MTRPNLFRPLKRAAKARPITAFDVEGNGQPGGFVCGAVVSDGGAYTFTHPGEMLSYLTSREKRGHWLFAHNLEYDLPVLTGGNLSPFSILFKPDGILWAETQDSQRHTWRFCDSANLFLGQSVADLGIMVGKRKLELHPVLERHCREGRPLSELLPDDQHRVLDYNQRDAEIVYLAVSLLQEELLSMGGQLSPTIAGCAMDLFRRKYLVAPWPTPDRGFNNLARLAYYGARTEPYRLGKVYGVSGYDLNSLYPSVQRELAFPDPGKLSVEISPRNLSQVLDRPGVSQATLVVPETYAPPLPARLGYHLYFPHGKLTGAWTHLELQHALESGVEIGNVEWSLTSTRTFNPFTTFIDTLYARKQLAASDSPVRRQVFKLLLNSSYGRYGINPDEGLSQLMPAPPLEEWDQYPACEVQALGDTLYFLNPVRNERQPAYANVLISAYVAAGARIRMHQEIERLGEETIYTDTDSIWLSGELPAGGNIGDWRLEYEERDLWIVAPKEYAVFSGESLLEARAKGVPRQAREYYLKYGEAYFTAPLKIREALQRGGQPSTWINRTRTAQYAVPKRAPLVTGDPLELAWLTRPWCFEELRRLHSLQGSAPGGRPLPPELEPALKQLRAASGR